MKQNFHTGMQVYIALSRVANYVGKRVNKVIPSKKGNSSSGSWFRHMDCRFSHTPIQG